MSAIQRITVLGSTGSVGENTLDVIARHDNLQAFALTAFDKVELLYQQCVRFRPRYAVVVSETAGRVLAEKLTGSDTEVLIGTENLALVAGHAEVDTVMAAIVGAAGLEATLAAVDGGKKVLLANKESLVMAGELFMARLRAGSARLLPIDSEHNAIFQCLPGSDRAADGSLPASVRRVILTASGGPFLDTPVAALGLVTPEQACRHPRWEMGRKISVDSATLMNKGLEFIEACYLFGLDVDRLEVVIHPQSIVHSLVEYLDGSLIAQLANPDMRIPIAYGLAWPERIQSGATSLNLATAGPLEFRAPDLDRFPCLGLGIEAARLGGTAPALLNAANEAAVHAFLEKRLSFDRIHAIIAQVMEKTPCEVATSLDIIREADSRGRSLANELIVKVNN